MIREPFLLDEPVWTLLLSIVILDEQITSIKCLGCGLILAALIIYRLPTILKMK